MTTFLMTHTHLLVLHIILWVGRIIYLQPALIGDLIAHIDVVNSFVSSNHFPLLLLLNCEYFHVMEHKESNIIPRIDWSSIDSASIDGYHNKTSQLLCNITLDYDMLNCNEMSCNNSDHKLSIDNIYLWIIKALCDSSHNFIPVVGKREIFQPIAGWNDYIKTAHSDAREGFLLWQSNSKPRFGPICDIMNSSRARFKQCLRFCKSNETRARADA